MFRSKRPIVNLALQGGGAHGAFTWGVLDRLFEADVCDVGWIGGTSAGAVNAVVTAAGLMNGGPAGARQLLRDFWDGVNKAASPPDIMKLNPFLHGFTKAASVSPLAALFSPYEFNPLGFDPMRKLLMELVDFEKLRSTSGPGLLVAATDIATGRARFFRRREMTVEAVLASACLPLMHHTVHIDGRGYWDGAFSANPDLVTMAMESPVADTLIVRLETSERDDLPRSVKAIAGHVSRLTFQQPLIRDVQLIVTARAAAGRTWRGHGRGPYAALADHRFHMIEAGRHVAGLAPDSKLKPDWGMLVYLHGAGRNEAIKWLERHKADIGRRETVDLAARFLAPASTSVASDAAATSIKPEAAE